MGRSQLPEGYKPSESESYMNNLQLEYFRRKLEDWKNELLEDARVTIGHLKEENWNEPDITDRASVEAYTSCELRSRDRHRKLLDKIDTALDRIKKGAYGYCEETGDEIGLRRLEARPIATLSIEAQERHESHEKQYNDED